MILYLILPAVPNQLEPAPTYVCCANCFSSRDSDLNQSQSEGLHADQPLGDI